MFDQVSVFVSRKTTSHILQHTGDFLHATTRRRPTQSRADFHSRPFSMSPFPNHEMRTRLLVHDLRNVLPADFSIQDQDQRWQRNLSASALPTDDFPLRAGRKEKYVSSSFPKNVRRIIHLQSSSVALRNSAKRGSISLSESPPSFSISASDKTNATIASRIGTARGTGKSPSARIGRGFGARSKVNGLLRSQSRCNWFHCARITIGPPFEIPPSMPPARLVKRCRRCPATNGVSKV